MFAPIACMQVERAFATRSSAVTENDWFPTYRLMLRYRRFRRRPNSDQATAHFARPNWTNEPHRHPQG